MYQYNHRKLRQEEKAFTLIELLVVIAIIGILASMLLPALKTAKEQAYSAMCVSNQKQCMMSMNLYANDFNEWFPSREGGTTAPTRPQRLWPDSLMYNAYLPKSPIITSYHFGGNVMSSHVKKNNVFSCPSLQPPETHITGGKTYINHEASTDLSYGLRYFRNNYPGETYADYAIKRLGIQQNLPYMADSTYITSTRQYGEIRTMDYGYNHGVIHRRHNSMANIAFPDGHVKSLNKYDILNLYPDRAAEPYSYP